tara:strand:- start:472 stop:2937 length:2466 start_codon:yes stop_codon:yes gene_type:complete
MEINVFDMALGPGINFDFENTQRQIRTGVNTSVVEEFVESSADRIVSTNIAQTMRSRDVTVTGENFKPNTRYYFFFDGIDVNAHMTPGSSTYGIGSGTAKGTGIRSDNLGAISATFTIPATNELSFTTGSKTLKVTDSSTNTPGSGSIGEAIYEASGQIQVVQEEITSTRNGRVVTDDVAENQRRPVRWVDPLAQSFLVDKDGGIFVSSVEFYFGAKDTALPVTAQIRHMENGMPTQKILPFGEKTLAPSAVNISSDGSSATKFTFPSPVYLESGREYCVVVMTNSNVYTAWVSEMGQKDIATNDFIDRQPYAGVLFKSQNNSTWTADQLKDLKMKLNRCKFTTGSAGAVVFENSGLSAETLQRNPIESVSGTKTFRVYHRSHGNYDEKLSNITIAGVKGDRTGSVLDFADDTITGLSGLTADTQTLVMTSSSGSGSGLTATIATSTTATTSIVITNPGQGFAANDTVVFTKDSVAITFTVASVDDTLGGIPISYINTTHIAGTSDSRSTSGAKIINDIDSYLITIPDATWAARSGTDGLNYQSAIESVKGGGDAVTATGNAYYDVIHTAIPSVELPNTAITTTFLGTGTRQPTTKAYAASYTKDSTSTTITLNDNNYLLSPKIVASDINQTNEMAGAKSLSITCQLSSTKDNVSPVLDVDSMGIIAIQNRINNVDISTDLSAQDNTTNTSTDFVASTEARGDSNKAVYMTKKVQLKEPANAIHVLFDGLKKPDASGTDPSIDVYYKTMGNDSNTQFTDLGWKSATIKETVPADASAYKEHTYEIENLEEFTVFSIKIVMQTVNTSNVPMIENFRAIALST